MQTIQPYSFVKSIGKFLVKGGVLVLPLLIHFLPASVLNLTLGGAGYLLVDFLQKKYTTL